MLSVEARIQAGIIPPLVEVQGGEVRILDVQAVEDELASLAEDILNWNCGHPLVADPVSVGEQ